MAERSFYGWWIVSFLLVQTIMLDHLPAEELRLFTRSERHMGTIATVKLFAADETAASQALDAALQRIGQLDSIMSDYQETSELSRLSAAAPTSQPVPMSADLWRVLSLSQAISESSDGAFDITVGPLTKLWRRSRRQKMLPSEERLAEALAAVGYRKLQLHCADRSVSLTAAGMRLDLGGIGQGFAADEALAVLRKLGFHRATVDISGDIAFGDPPPNETGWQTGIAPLDANAPPSTILRLANCAVSTSGDAFQFVEIDGRRYSHIVDPKTGLGLTDRSSVTVIAKDCASADALATAVCVLGPTRGLEIIEQREDISALIVFLQKQQPVTLRSKRFPAEAEQDPKPR